MGSMMVVCMAVKFTYFLHHAHSPTLMMMVGYKAQQQQQKYCKGHAESGTGLFHAANLGIYFCKWVANTTIGTQSEHLKRCHHSKKEKNE